MPGDSTPGAGLLFNGKVFFSHTALRTHPVVGKILKGSAGSDAGIRVADCRIVIIAACVAEISFHEELLI